MPGVPVCLSDGIREGQSLEDALTGYPWPRHDLDVPPPERRPQQLLLSIERTDGEEVRMDQPVGASFQTRRFLARRVASSFVKLGYGVGEVPVRKDAEEDIDVPVAVGNQPQEP